MSSHVPSGLPERIRILKSVLDEVTPRSFDEWLHSFENDGSPEDELLIWECIALTYSTFVETHTLTAEAKEEVISVLLLCSMGMTEEYAKSKRKVLRESEIWILFTLYRASADATIAVNNGRQTSY
jgi:hypothetical protein